MIEEQQVSNLLRRLAEVDGLRISDPEAIVHALVDIEESMNKIYGELIPRLLDKDGLEKDAAVEVWWDIREEFRHIAYHIDDGNLTEL